MTEDQIPETPPIRRLTVEQFEAELIAIRNGATLVLTEQAAEGIKGGEQHNAIIEDARQVWHAAEIALALIAQGYVPKREAIEDVRALLESLDDA